jgi:hypothetical protein
MTNPLTNDYTLSMYVKFQQHSIAYRPLRIGNEKTDAFEILQGRNLKSTRSFGLVVFFTFWSPKNYCLRYIYIYKHMCKSVQGK